MKQIIYKKLILIAVFLIASVIVLSGCTDKGSPSLWNGVSTAPIGTAPVISSISPANEALAGVTVITITGQNFSTNSFENLVYFRGLPGTVISSSASQITVTSPIIFGDSIQVKVAVTKAELFSNAVSYKLLPAVAEFYTFDNSMAYPYGIVSDKAGNIYASLKEFSVGAGIKIVGIDSTITPWAPKGGETFFNNMKFGPNNAIYAARKVRAIFIVEAGIAAKTWVSTGIGSITDFDFDQNGNIWAGGAASNGNIYLVKPDKSVVAFPFAGEVTSVKVFGSNLFLASTDGGQTSVWKIPINGDTLGTPEQYFDFTAQYPKATINAIAFAADGDLYLGTDLPEAVIVVHTDKSAEPLYPGLFERAPVFAFAAGPGNYLYYTRLAGIDPVTKVTISQTILRINLGKPVATQY